MSEPGQACRREQNGPTWARFHVATVLASLLAAPHTQLVGTWGADPAAMKFNPGVSGSRRKSRKVQITAWQPGVRLCSLLKPLCVQAHFTAPSSARHKLMSAPLASELRTKYSVSLQQPSGSSNVGHCSASLLYGCR